MFDCRIPERHVKKIEKDILYLKRNDLCEFIDDVILYGSCVRGEAKYNSDIDLFIVFKSNFDVNSQKKAIDKIRQDLRGGYEELPETDIHIAVGNLWEKSNSAFYKFIRREGKSIWEKD